MPLEDNSGEENVLFFFFKRQLQERRHENKLHRKCLKVLEKEKCWVRMQRVGFS